MRVVAKEDRQWLTDYRNQLLLKLMIAYKMARSGGKRGTFDEHKFEAYDFENLVRLRNSLLDKTYKPSRGTAHVIFNPVQREIFAAPFVDRVVHHFVYNIIYDWWDRRFIEDSYSCREGKGTKYGIERLSYHMQTVSEDWTKEICVVKLDIQGYFMSIPRRTLYEMVKDGLDRQFKEYKGKEYEVVLHCIRQIIFDDPCQGVIRQGWPQDWEGLPQSKSLFNQPPGVGIVIGNLTSQLFSNVFLDKLDRFVVFDLGYKHYGRYVDDFYIVIPIGQLTKLRKDIKRIERFLARIGLALHPQKRHFYMGGQGVDFLGGVVYPGQIYPGQRVIRNARKAFYEVEVGVRDIESVVSYLGHMKYFRSEGILQKLFDEVGWEGEGFFVE